MSRHIDVVTLTEAEYDELTDRLVRYKYLHDCATGIIQELLEQVSQMRGMFPDDDKAIDRAVFEADRFLGIRTEG